MQPSISFQKPQRVSKTSNGHIQIHHFRNHWVVSHLNQGQVYVYDSLNPTTIATELHEQLKTLYFKEKETSTINLIHVHKQPNLVDCGLYAIANATAIAFGEAPEENLYDEKRM